MTTQSPPSSGAGCGQAPDWTVGRCRTAACNRTAAIGDVGKDDTAFDQRDALVEFVASATWRDPAEDDAHMGAARRYAADLEPHASAYVNVLSDEGEAGVQRAYRGDKLIRLGELKDRYDPDNVFHLNHNIRPRRPAERRR
jgi:hypothetical protein